MPISGVRFLGHKPKRGLAIAILVLVVVAVSCAHGTSQSGDLGVTLSDDEPFGGAVKTTLAGAQGAVGFHVYRPHDWLASDSSLTTVWMAPHNGQVALYYASGVQVFDAQPSVDGHPESPPSQSQIEADYRAAATEMDIGVMRIHGVLASIIPQNLPDRGCVPSQDVCMPASHNPGSVTLWLGGIQVTVYGHYPTSALVRVAESLG